MLVILMVMMAYGCIENVSNGVIQIYRQLEPRFKKKKLCKNNFDITVPKPKWNIQMGNKRLYLSRSTFSGIRIKTNAPNSYLISYIN